MPIIPLWARPTRSPPTLGAVAVNARFLNRSGLPPAAAAAAAAAAATVEASQVAAFVVHVALMLLTAIAAGTQADLHFNPPFRLVTFWLPTVPGWFAFRNLTAKGLLSG